MFACVGAVAVQGPKGDAIARRLNVHFKKKTGNAHCAISVRGATLSVPLPVTLTPSRAQAVWAHELGTHFLRGVVNEPCRRNVLSQNKEHTALLNTSANYMVPIGGKFGWEDHQKRLEWWVTGSRRNERAPVAVRIGFVTVAGNSSRIEIKSVDLIGGSVIGRRSRCWGSDLVGVE